MLKLNTDPVKDKEVLRLSRNLLRVRWSQKSLLKTTATKSRSRLAETNLRLRPHLWNMVRRERHPITLMIQMSYAAPIMEVDQRPLRTNRSENLRLKIFEWSV